MSAALLLSIGVVQPITGPWPQAFPAKDLCSNCGLCRSTVGVPSVVYETVRHRIVMMLPLFPWG